MAASATPVPGGNHPAVRAWEQLNSRRQAPDTVQALKTGETEAYRLSWAAAEMADVIAKRAARDTVELERFIYQEILPALSLPALRCDGLVDAGAAGWLFIEDADEGSVTAALEGERTMMARWLGELHARAAGMSASPRLPDRGPKHYLGHLRASHTMIRDNLTHPAFTDGDRVLAARLLLHLEEIELRWAAVQEICQESPKTLVHGDLVPKNYRLRVQEGRPVVLAFDWETAGWGVPAADLAGFARRPDVSAIDAYLCAIRPTWPEMDFAAVQRLACIGYVFRLLAAADWAARGLNFDWIERSWRLLRHYEPDLRTAVAMDWGN